MMIDIDLLLAYGAAFKKIGKGNIIFREGTTCCFYYQLVSGRVKWMNISDEGKEFIHTIIEPGECFGEIPLFDDEPYAATAIADEDIVVVRLHKPVFNTLINENRDIHFKFTRLLAKKVRFKLLLSKSFAGHDPETRIMSLLNYLKKENKNFCIDCMQLNLTRQQIADMTGLRVETVIRTMRHMHEKGELVINKGKVFCKSMTMVIPPLNSSF
jgi:CRP/FNR family cyclic AMP-dependent transcriptional regulator